MIEKDQNIVLVMFADNVRNTPNFLQLGMLFTHTYTLINHIL